MNINKYTEKAREAVEQIDATHKDSGERPLVFSSIVNDAVRAEIDKDFVKLPVHEIEKHLAG